MREGETIRCCNFLLAIQKHQQIAFRKILLVHFNKSELSVYQMKAVKHKGK